MCQALTRPKPWRPERLKLAQADTLTEQKQQQEEEVEEVVVVVEEAWRQVLPVQG
jgi:hypothetical protein